MSSISRRHGHAYLACYNHANLTWKILSCDAVAYRHFTENTIKSVFIKKFHFSQYRSRIIANESNSSTFYRELTSNSSNNPKINQHSKKHTCARQPLRDFPAPRIHAPSEKALPRVPKSPRPRRSLFVDTFHLTFPSKEAPPPPPPLLSPLLTPFPSAIRSRSRRRAIHVSALFLSYSTAPSRTVRLLERAVNRIPVIFLRGSKKKKREWGRRVGCKNLIAGDAWFIAFQKAVWVYGQDAVCPVFMRRLRGCLYMAAWLDCCWCGGAIWKKCLKKY